MPPAPIDSPTSSRYTAVVGGPTGDERGLYGAPGPSQLGVGVSEMNRRHSTDHNLPVGHNRPGAFAGRHAETNLASITTQFGESTAYPYSNEAHGRSQRPSISSASVSLAPETTRAQQVSFSNDGMHTDLSEPFSRAMNLTAGSPNGYMNHGYNGPMNPPFQPSPASRPWQQPLSNGTRNLGRGTQQEAWPDSSHVSYPSAKRGSMERVSPAGSSNHPNFASPRNISGTANPRPDPWNRPAPRAHHMSQDLDRRQDGPQYTQAPAEFYPPFTNPQYSEFIPSYEPYTHSPNYRASMPSAPYGTQINVMGANFRPNGVRDVIPGTRSMLLDQFRSVNKSNKRYELQDIYGHVVEFSGDQHGSRFIQDKLVMANSEEKERVFVEIEPNAVQLMKDVFGNYVIQKFFEHGNQIQKKMLAQKMKGNVHDLSTQMYSCRVVQKALEHVLVEQQKEIVAELQSNILPVTKDPHGNHVIQKIIHMFPKNSIPFAMDAFKGQIESLAQHSYACRVIQRILEYGTEAEKEVLMTDIHKYAAKLMSDQYGNYVIQHIISQGKPEDRSIMIRHAIDKLQSLSRHKYASNVVEKCIEHGTVEERRAILAKLRTPTPDGEDALEVLMLDQYGNYVIQKLIKGLEGDAQAAFVVQINTLIPQLSSRCGARQNAGLERLVAVTKEVTSPEASTNNVNGCAATVGTAPSTPNIAIGEGSTIPTPALTTEQSSPQSSSPPSTNISTADDASDDLKTVQASLSDEGPLSPVHVREN